ncbi:1,4-alpha-glucan branching protein GlgB [Planosporangium flavigriseum]|uniref:1,4-alpha-glucan branching enzyme GlgB n=1 Tax=Planosporangium flavigriseum TaxID=373681 RepID=A0A8J3PP14_9ACTN|nr:1,4-alpha-glucan branching protein GlgB [Planosporangium flavigriseum]NJC65975.1 1,4-alpha-glucan branching protein GlgB [Planosporangium flavigriseum]GIG74561.1 1,4-alpha-glucan branching enzyme GlgB [Planosporangium flavigriseum]
MDELIRGDVHDPHAILGAHPTDDHTVIRTLRRGATIVEVVVETPDGVKRYPMKRCHRGGIFEATVPGWVPDYRIEVDGELHDDPYRYPPTLGELDLHLIGEGRHERLWEALGSQPSENGVAFAVWAPNARGIRVAGDFVGWGPDDGWPMRSLGGSGVWEIFVPEAEVGQRYKYRVLGKDGVWREKADPLAKATEVPPRTASVIYESHYDWKDADWLARRAKSEPHVEPMSIYEVHLGSWRPGLSYTELADQLTEYVVETGFTHVEFMPVMEHPFGGSWGYQVTGYYAPTARFGTPDEFRYLVDRLHSAGIGVLIDWVPAHFPKDEWALARFDGTPLYEHADPLRGEHPDWGTYIFDYGRREVRNFLVANALYWCEEFHVDGLRVDAVASMLYLDYSRQPGQWTPNKYGGRENLDAIEFLQETNASVYKHHPGIVTVAEESTAWPGVTRPTHAGGLGFGFKWNMGWMNDTLAYLSKEPVHRQWHHHQMTFSTVYAWSENYVLPLSHDEVVHGKGSLVGKMPGDLWQKLANVRALLAFMWAHPGKQLLFMGSELGDDREWSEERGLDWSLLSDPARAGMKRLVSDLNVVYRDTPALWTRDTDPAGFRWISAEDSANNTFSFVRLAPDGSPLVCVVNFAAVPHENYRIGLPQAGAWAEVINTDADIYGGSGVGNLGTVHAENSPSHGLPASATLRIPPLGALWLRPASDESTA